MADRHLILDVSVIVDMWLDPDVDTNPTAQLFKLAADTGTTLWVCASALPTLEFVTLQRLKALGVEPARARTAVRRLMAQLLDSVQVSTVFGFEQADAYRAARDFEDAQIAASARSLEGARMAIVTLDKSFDALGVCETLAPAAALAWLHT